nr:hypothetical protein GCM10020093_046130 [Planobispora longispora]
MTTPPNVPIEPHAVDPHVFDDPAAAAASGQILDSAEEVHVGLTLDAVRPPSHEEILRVENLTVEFPTEDGVVHAVRGVSYGLREREVLGIVGESGSGKSVSSSRSWACCPRAPGSRAGSSSAATTC